MTHLIKIDIDKTLTKGNNDTETVVSALLDVFGSFDLMKADHTFFIDSDEVLDYIEEGGNFKLHVTEFTGYLKGMLNELEWKFI